MTDYSKGGKVVYAQLDDEPEYLECYNKPYCRILYFKAEEANCE
jgi:hypothetical protein